MKRSGGAVGAGGDGAEIRKHALMMQGPRADQGDWMKDEKLLVDVGKLRVQAAQAKGMAKTAPQGLRGIDAPARPVKSNPAERISERRRVEMSYSQ